MSAAEHQSRNASSQSDKQKSLNNPPQRPSLLQPPPRPAATPQASQPEAAEKVAPKRPAPSAAPAPAVADSLPPDVETNKAAFKNHPIAPPSEPMQYRAIGLVRGTYQPSEEQLNRGNILAEDGTLIDAVLLGRVTSLIKKHIDLANSHLWVVYPRTRQASEEETEENNDGALHLQIVGVWEPETLGLPGENPNTLGDREADEEESAAVDNTSMDETAAPTAEDTSDSTDADIPSENYFSIRGEIINYDEDEGKLLVKIVQGAKRSGKPPKAFKLHISGEVAGKTVGYFWDLEVERQGEELVLIAGHSIGIVPPKKKKKGKPFGPRKGGGRRPNTAGPGGKPKPNRNYEKPRIRPSAPVKSNPL